MNYVRSNLSQYKKINNGEDLPGSSTLVVAEYLDPTTDRTGFYKCNSDDKSNEDLRELLGSIILKTVGVPCAEIVPVYDDVTENKNGCLSMNILNPGEFFVEPDISNGTGISPDVKESIDTCIATDFHDYKNSLQYVPEDFWDKRKSFLINYYFASALIGNDDIKSENCKVIFNSNYSSYRNPEYYDMNVAFTGLSCGRSFYDGKSDIDILLEIYSKYPEQVRELSKKVSENLSMDYIEKILDDGIFEGFSPEERKRILSELGKKIDLINKKNEMLYGQKNPQNGFTFTHEDLAEVSKGVLISWEEKAMRILKKVKELFIDRNGR